MRMDLNNLRERIVATAITQDEKMFATSVDALFTDIKAFMSDKENIKQVERSSIEKAQQTIVEVQAMLEMMKKECEKDEEDSTSVLISALDPHKLIQFNESLVDLSDFLRLGHKIEPTEGMGKGSRQ